MKKLFLFVLLLSSSLIFSQKFKVKDGFVTVDGKNWIKCVEPASYTFSLFNNNDDEIIFIKPVKILNAEPITQYNTDGSITYFLVKFLGLKKEFECRMGYKDLFKILYMSKAINEDLTLNEEKVDLLVEKYGTEFSDKYNNKSETIIIKEENKSQRPKNNFNIRIGN